MPSYASGFEYQPQFISPAEEQALLEALRGLPLAAARYREYTAKRRIASFESEPDIPRFLHGLREKVGAWLGIAPPAFSHILVAEYRPGVGVGWHRDMPQFAVVAGVSLGGSARMRFRPWAAGKRVAQKALGLELERRSAYVLRNDVRWNWQHQIAPTQELRYSITFRTLMSA